MISKSKSIFIIILVSCIFFSGCIKDKTTTTTGTPKNTEQQVNDVISKLDENNPESIASVEELVGLGEPAVPALKEKLDDKNVVTRWASAYALSNIGPISSQKTKSALVDDLKKAYSDEEDTISVTAAATAVGIGEKSGFPILIAALRNDDGLMLIEPRRSISSYAIQVLRGYTGQEYGYDLHTPLSERAQAINEWENWYAQNKDKLVWDQNMGEYGGYRT